MLNFLLKPNIFCTLYNAKSILIYKNLNHVYYELSCRIFSIFTNILHFRDTSSIRKKHVFKNSILYAHIYMNRTIGMFQNGKHSCAIQSLMYLIFWHCPSTIKRKLLHFCLISTNGKQMRRGYNSMESRGFQFI